MTWWHWLVLGLVLIALEMAASGGFYVIFFGIAALSIVGLLQLLGIWRARLAPDRCCFPCCRSASLLLFRSPLHAVAEARKPGAATSIRWSAKLALPLEDIAPGGSRPGRAARHVWIARNAAARRSLAAQRCTWSSRRPAHC